MSPESLDFLSESSGFRFFRHDVVNKRFSFDKESLRDMGLTGSEDISEKIVMESWGEDLYKEYLLTAKNNFKLKNYKYRVTRDKKKPDEMVHSTISVVLFSNEEGDMAFVEAIYSNEVSKVEQDRSTSLFQEDEFREILNNINALVFIVDKNYNIVDYNYEGTNVFGLSAMQVDKSIPISKHFAFPYEKLDNVFNTGKSIRGYQSTLVDSDNNVRNYIINIAKINKVDNNSFLIFSGIDITESLMLENQLILNELKFKSIFEQSPVGIHIYDKDAALLDANETALQILDVNSKEELLGLKMYDSLSLSEEEILKVEEGSAYSFSKTYDVDRFSKYIGNKNYSKGTKDLDVTLLKINSNKDESEFGYIELLVDKTEENNAYKSYKKSSDQLFMATSAGHIGIFEIDLESRTYIANFETVMMFGNDDSKGEFSLEEFLSRIHPEDINELIEIIELLESGKTDDFSIEYRFEVGEDSWKWIKTTASVSGRSSSGNAVHVVGVNIDIDDLKRAREEASNSERLLRQTLNVGQIGLWEYSVKNDSFKLGEFLVKSLNLGYSTFNGASFTSQEFFSIIHPDYRGEVESSYNQIISGEREHLIFECRLNNNYNNVWVSITAFVNERDLDGIPTDLNGFIININEKNTALEEAKRKEYFISTSLEIAKVGFYYTCYEDDTIEVSDTYCNIFKVDKCDFSDIESFARNRVHHDDRLKYLRFINSFKDENSSDLKRVNYRVLIDGVEHRILEYATVHFDEENKRKGTLFAVQDVTEIYEKETRLQELLDNQRSVSELSVVMMANLEPKAMIEKLLLNVKSRMKARKISFYLKSNSSYILKNSLGTSYCSYSQGGNIIHESDIEYLVNRLKTNNPVIIDCSESIYSDNPFVENILFTEDCSTLFLPVVVRNTIYGFLALNVDFSHSDISSKDFGLMNSFIHLINLAFEKLQSHSELIEAKDRAEKADKLKTSFLENMSHEIRTPLNSIVGFSGLIADAVVDENSEVAEYAEVLGRNTEDLLSIISNVIDFSEIESSNLFICSKLSSVEVIFEEINNRCKMIDKPDVKILYNRPEGEEVFINTDNLRLKQIMLNLVCNAYKYTTKGSIEYGYESKDDGVLFHVFDTGIGIKEEEKEKIFDRFYQADKMSPGTGLGLSIVKALVEELQGRLWFESEEGKGVKFFVYIPNFKE